MQHRGARYLKVTSPCPLPAPFRCGRILQRSVPSITAYCRLVGTLDSRQFLAQFNVWEVGLPNAGTGRRIGMSPPASAVPFHRDAEA